MQNIITTIKSLALSHRQSMKFGVVVIVIAMTIIAPVAPAFAATYTWNQNSWTGGVNPTATTSHNPNANNNTTGWTKYGSASNVSIGSTITLSSSTASIVQTDDTNSNSGFNLTGTANSGTTLPGTGSAKLDYSGTGLVGGYHFNNDGVDFSGNNNLLTINNSAPIVQKINTTWTVINSGGGSIGASGGELSAYTPGSGYSGNASQNIHLDNASTLTFLPEANGGGSFSISVSGVGTTIYSTYPYPVASIAIPAGDHSITFSFTHTSGGSGGRMYVHYINLFDQPSAYASSGKFSQAFSTVTGQNGSYTTSLSIGANWTIASHANFPLTSTGSGSYNVLTQSNSSPTDYQVVERKSDGHLGTIIGNVFKDSSYVVSPLSGWHHVAAVGSGANTLFYIDGVLVGTAAGKSTGDIKYIGNDSTGNQPWGGLDDLLIFTVHYLRLNW